MELQTLPFGVGEIGRVAFSCSEAYVIDLPPSLFQTVSRVEILESSYARGTLGNSPLGQVPRP